MIVHWTNTARRHLQGIHDHIALDSVRYALRVVDRITRRTTNLADHPYIGWVVEEYGQEAIREVVEYSYRIIYKVKPDQIDILAVIHGAKRLPRSLE